ncbi:MAG: hypothetical protein NE334_06790 [Lentisphaeraceae bacterium]|nr:hypothetical protein [Lentisphaeraceae bacterium]
MIDSFIISLLRALILALLTCFCSRQVYLTFLSLRGRQRFWLALLTLFPLIIPPLLPAYAYSAFKINFQTQPILNEFFYGLIVISKTLPFVFIALYFIKYSTQSSAILCDKLKPNSSLSFIKRNAALFVATTLAGLIIFHEYEIASLMRIRHWTIDVFNAHAGGLSHTIIGSIKMVSAPLTTSLFAIFILIRIHTPQTQKITLARSPNQSFAYIILTLLLLTSFIVPYLIVIKGAWGGFYEILQTNWMLQETFNSIIFAIVSTLCVAFLSHLVVSSLPKFIPFFIAPGLCGTLILGLLILAFFQITFLQSLAHSILPLTLAQIIYIFPLAIVVRIFIKNSIQQSSLTSAHLLSNKEKLNWKLYHLPTILAHFPLFCILWFDITLNTLLAPTSLPGIFPRLYNLMHYNENEKLSATVVIAVLVPPIILALVLFISRIGILCKIKKTSGN